MDKFDHLINSIGINLPCVSSWTLVGQQLQVWLKDRKRLRAFNIFMAVLLVASVLFSML